MIPGTVSKLSEQNISLATSITVKSDIVRVTSTATTTVVATIIPSGGGFSTVLFLVNDSGASMTAVTTGNIYGTGTITVLDKRMAVLVFSKLLGKWLVANDT